MSRILLLSFIVLGMSACASKAPVQAMAEARAAVQSIRPLYASEEAQQKKTYSHYQSAEKALIAATKALDEKRYAAAKQKAQQAKQQARLAAKLK